MPTKGNTTSNPPCSRASRSDRRRRRARNRRVFTVTWLSRRSREMVRTLSPLSLAHEEDQPQLRGQLAYGRLEQSSHL